jgi:hypothetical protein
MFAFMVSSINDPWSIGNQFLNYHAQLIMCAGLREKDFSSFDDCGKSNNYRHNLPMCTRNDEKVLLADNYRLVVIYAA